jgi:hypothetical protein
MRALKFIPAQLRKTWLNKLSIRLPRMGTPLKRDALMEGQHAAFLEWWVV